MAATIDIPETVGIIFLAVFLTYGMINLLLRPFESPLYATEKLRSTVNERYIQLRKLLAVVYLIFAVGGWLVIPWGITAESDDRVPFVFLTGLNLFFALHAEVLVGLCSPKTIVWRKRAIWILPLVILCGICLLFPQAATVLGYIQLFILLLLIGYYTPVFFERYTFMLRCRANAVGEEYDSLPKSMPWITRLYIALLQIALLSAICCFMPCGWHTWLIAALYVVYIVLYMNRIFFTYTLYSKMIKHVIG